MLLKGSFFNILYSLIAKMISFKGLKKLKKLRRPAIPVPPAPSASESADSRDSSSSADSSEIESDSSDFDFDYVDEDDEQLNLEEESNRQLLEEGLDVHLKSSFCNQKSNSMVKTMISRFVKLIVFIHVTLNINGVMNTGFILSSLITDHFKILPVYYEHLKERVLLQASTIIDLNENVQALVHWFCVYRTSLEYPLESSSLYNINLVIKTMRKVYLSVWCVCLFVYLSTCMLLFCQLLNLFK
jgi:hypothetical protein